MPQGDVETLHVEGQWRNVVVGTDQVSEPFDTVEEAVVEGRETARELAVEHIVKDLDGSIAERSSYGTDPRDVPG